jgi:hypothetical protein
MGDIAGEVNGQAAFAQRCLQEDDAVAGHP